MFDYKFDYDAVIAALGIQSSDDEFKEHVLGRVHELLDARTGMIFQDALSDEEILQLGKLTEANDREGAEEFLKQRFPNYKEVYDHELTQIVNELKTALS